MPAPSSAMDLMMDILPNMTEFLIGAPVVTVFWPLLAVLGVVGI